MVRLQWIPLLLLPFLSEGVRLSQETQPAACTFSSPSPVLLAVSSDASVDTLIYRSTVSPPSAILSLLSVTSTKLPHINYTNRFDLSTNGNGQFIIRTKGRLSLPPYPSEITTANLYMSVVCNEQVFPLITLRLDGGNRVAPRFYGLPYAVSLPRKSPVGTEINTGIIAIDWDPSLAYGVHFSILDDWAPFSLVVRPVSSNSPSLSLPLQGWSTDQFPPQIRLKVIGSIDHLPNEFDLNIAAIDNGEPVKTNMTKIHVNLLGEYRPLVRESRVRSLIGEAKMGDQVLVIPSVSSVVDEENGPVIYSLVDKKMKDYFEIDPERGSLTLIEQPPLTVKSLGVMVTSKENPPRSAIVEITLQRDVSFPRFSSCDFSVSLPENSKPGTHVFEMHVIDRNEDTRIRLIDPDETFSLDQETGVVTVHDPTVLDSEHFDLVQFVIQIESINSSVAPPSVCQKARVTVHLIDENDNSPLFDKTQYRIRVISPLPNNTLLRSIRAVDYDKGDNGRVEYRLADADNLPIRLISTNGTAELIYSQRPNTRPLIGRYYVTLEAVDHGDPQRFGRAIIEIEADDLSGMEEGLEMKLREEERAKKKEEKRVAKVADHSTTRTTEGTKTTSSVVTSSKKTATSPAVTQSASTERQTVATTESTTAKTAVTVPLTTSTTKKGTTPSTTTETKTSPVTKTTTTEKSTTKGRTIATATTQRKTTERTTTEAEEEELLTDDDETEVTAPFTQSTPRVTKTLKESTKRAETEKEKRVELSEDEEIEEEEVTVTPVRKHKNHELDEAEEMEEETVVERVENKRKEKTPVSDPREEEEIVSRFHRDEKSTPERKIFAFNEPSYSFELFGEWKEGEVIGRVSASPDAMFYAMDKKAAAYFKIDGDTGDIIVHSEADQLKGDYTFTVSSTNGEFTTESLVSIRLDKTRSIFDSTPTFDQSVYSIHVQENEEPKPLSSLRAYHRGLSTGSSLIYSLLDDGANVPFYLDEKSGQLVLLAPLDHEKTKEISFKVSACLSSNPSSCGFAMVRIIVDDVNDNAPVLQQREISVKLPSDLPKGSTVAHFKATDKDSKENGEISYAINPPSNTFAIDIDNGDVITLGPLEHAHYEMAIQAFDHGIPRRSDIGRLTVNVQGTNPSAPQFDQFRYDVTLTGPVKAGERVVSLHASDPDPGDEGVVSYRFATAKNGKETRDQSRFSMNPHTGAVTTLTPLNSFDGPFLFVVEAVDNSKYFPRKAETLLRIRVEGEPSLRFFALPSTLFISSNKGIGSVVLRASASSSEGTPITFSISPPSPFFSMDGPNLIVTKTLDPKEYNISIVAETDGANISHSLHVIVMTNRDKYPVFSRLFYDLPVSLDASFPSTLHTFEARVQTGVVEYSLFPPKAVPVGLAIDKHTGELTVSEEFISSTAHKDTVFTVVRAWNSEFPQFHSDVGVILTLSSPSTPFGFPLSLYRTIISENTPVGTLLNSSVAIAPKSLRTGVEYGITPSNIIGIHSNGSLYVAGPIDLEAMPVDEEGTLTYTIWAESGDERAVSTMRVKIVGRNEFNPVFRHKIFRFNVDESAKPGVILGRIIADDADFGEKLIYSMKSESRADSIEILPNGSVIVGKAGIDFDSDRAFDLVVSVEDSTGKTDEATVEIVVIADDDRVTKVENNSPIVWNITSDSSSPLPITAVDSDEKDSIEFKIAKGNERGFFEIERVNRTAVLLKPVSPLPSPSRFILTIEAVDSTKISTSRVIVNVAAPSTRSIPSTTSSPRVPLFSQNEYAKAVKDDTPVGTALISVQVWSPPQDGEVAMTSNCSFLNVHNNGVVVLATPVPIQSGEIDCAITASNEHSSTTAPFHLLVLDSSSSNHAPIFDRSTYNFSISTDSFASVVGKINVHDEDGDEVKLEIQPPEYNQLFDLNEQNEIELRFPASTLTDQNVFSFIVVASDDGKPKQTSIANVKVFVRNGKKGGFFPIASSASTNSAINPIPTSLTALSTPKSSEVKETETTTHESKKETTTVETVKVTTTQVELVTNDFTTVVPPVEKVTEKVIENTSEGSGSEEEEEEEEEVEEASTIKMIENELVTSEEVDEKLKDVTTLPTIPVKFSKKEYRFGVKKDARVGTVIGSVKVDGIDSTSSLEFMIGDERVATVDENGQVSLTGPVIPSPYSTPVIVFKDGRILDEASIVIEYSDPSSTSSAPSSPSPSISPSTSPSTAPSTLSRSSTLTSSTVPSTTTVMRVEGGTTPRDSPTVVPSSTTSSAPPFAFSHSLYTASMPEGAYKNGALVQLTPSNIHTNGKDVTFALEDAEGLPFVMNENTGELAIFRVDREQKSNYDLVVKAFDHSSNEESTAKIHVEIVDVNDNPPVIDSVPSIIGVRRDVAVGSVIGRVSAIDGDSGQNGQLTYSIQPSQYFAIDQKKGSIIVRTPLLNVPSDQLMMNVVVADGGRPALKAETEIELRLFSSIRSPTLPRSSTISVSRSSIIIANLLAVPNVGEDNQSVTYTLDSTHDGLFAIDASGVLSMGREPRPSEVNGEHKVKITATNNFGSDNTEIGVMIVDGSVTTSSSTSSSSSSPSTPSSTVSSHWEGGSSTVNTRESAVCMFPVREYRAEIKENLPAGTPVIKVSSDCEAKGDPVKYSLAVNSVDFSVDAQSGDIVTLRPLDREEKAIHLLVVNVTREVTRRSERGTQAEESLEALRSRLNGWQTIVIVRVVDENDSSPEWKHLNGEGKMVASMDWKTPIGSPLMKIHASDKDEKKSRLKYSIEGDVKAFAINETTGLIYLQKSVESDSTDMYSMTGIVTDGVHQMRVPIEIYRLSTQYHLVKLVSERRHVDIDAKKLVAEINNATSLNVHILSKQPFVDSKGVVDPTKSLLFVYALDDNHVPRRGRELLEWLSPHSASLYQTSGRISSFSAAQPTISISWIQLLWILVALLVLVALFIVCCVACSFLKRRRLHELEKQYMVDGMRPRPYDVENIPRSTAQTVLSSRRLAEAIPDDDRMSRTSNRSDTTFVFANSVKDENSLRRSTGRSTKVHDSSLS